jgi:hypothetical protein
MSAALHARSVILSDCIERLVVNLERNIRANMNTLKRFKTAKHKPSQHLVNDDDADCGFSVKAECIDWRDALDPANTMTLPTADIILGSDIVYGAMDPDELVAVVKRCLRPGGTFHICIPDSSGGRGTFSTRGNTTGFLEAMKEAGFGLDPSEAEVIGKYHDGFYDCSSGRTQRTQRDSLQGTQRTQRERLHCQTLKGVGQGTLEVWKHL